jgi:hypothetical protein
MRTNTNYANSQIEEVACGKLSKKIPIMSRLHTDCFCQAKIGPHVIIQKRSTFCEIYDII